MTKNASLCADWLSMSIASFLLIVAASQFRAPRYRGCRWIESKVEIARSTIKKYAYEAFPSWAAEHPTESCPRSLLELNEYMNNKDDRDPWGGRYVMWCTPRDRVDVVSAGEDGMYGTADDIHSWD